MLETVTTDGSAEDAARLLRDFNLEYDEPSPPVEQLAPRLAELVAGGQVVVLLARDGDGLAVGVAAMRVQPSIIGLAQEAYLAELYVVPGRRGHGFGRELVTGALDEARRQGADYMFLVTSEEDELAQRVYEAAGFRRTEGENGPVMLAYERDL